MKGIPVWLIAAHADLRARWSRWLASEGYSVVEKSGPDALRQVAAGRAAVVLLDAALIKPGDMALVREASVARVPVIVFGEGAQASPERMVALLREGADDFIASSIHERLLLAKLEAHLRRFLPELDRAVLVSPRRRIKADLRRGLAWTREAARWKPVPALTETEHRLLCLFLSNPGTTLDRGAILESLWGERAAEVFSATLTQHMMSLRKKLGHEGDDLRTVYGRGYRLAEHV